MVTQGQIEEKQELAKLAAKRRELFPMLDQDHIEFLYGVMQAIGLRPELNPVYEEEDKIFRFPFLDAYWDRPGTIFLTTDEANRADFRRLSAQTKLALRNAHEAGDIASLVDMKRVKSLSLLLGWAGT